jgi:hypothetical protein
LTLTGLPTCGPHLSSNPMARSSQAQAQPSPSADRKSPSRTGSAHRHRTAERSDVLVSAVISTYLLTHLHHVLQRAEYAANQEGHKALAANYAQLRKVLCLDARSMEDASASGTEESCGASAA